MIADWQKCVEPMDESRVLFEDTNNASDNAKGVGPTPNQYGENQKSKKAVYSLIRIKVPHNTEELIIYIWLITQFGLHSDEIQESVGDIQ